MGMECTVNETARERSTRRSRIIGDVYAAWVAEEVANETFQAAVIGDVTSEEHAELAFLSAEPKTSYTAAQLRRFEKRVCDRVLWIRCGPALIRAAPIGSARRSMCLRTWFASSSPDRKGVLALPFQQVEPSGSLVAERYEA